MQRHRHNGIEALYSSVGRNFFRQRPRQEPGEPLTQRLHAGVLEKKDQISQRSIVETKGKGLVEPMEAGGAQRAKPLLVQRKTIGERGMATGTEIFRKDRLRGIQAIRADGNSGDSD